MLILLTAACTPALSLADTTDIKASPVTDISVTVYRGSGRTESLDLDDLEGFAFITETRTISIPAGESRIRFEGVADGIDPASAILTGLPTGLVEKNHDAHVLSPSALVAATVGHPVTWLRTNPKTGHITATPGTLLSDADGVIFQATTGEIEALRCSGLPETFAFEPSTDTNATPTLSALVRTTKPVQAEVKLSYLARGFDWMANYSAVISPDEKTLTLGGWVTLANSNSVSFVNAHAKVVAGRVNREDDPVEPIDFGHPIQAQCWPRGSTSDPVMIRMVPAAPRAMAYMTPMAASADAGELEEIAVTSAKAVKEEQLGDLKLYRVPDRTSVVSRQIKQVRLTDRSGIPVQTLYRAELSADDDQEDMSLKKILRTKNTASNHLGLPLPSGRVSTFALLNDDTPLLLDEAQFDDTALNQDVELDLGDSDDVHLSATVETRQPSTRAKNRIEITNARPIPVRVEISVLLEDDGSRMVDASPRPTRKNGLPTFEIEVPANGQYTIRYTTAAPTEH